MRWVVYTLVVSIWPLLGLETYHMHHNMSDPYLYHGCELWHHGFLQASINLRHGDYRSSPRILEHEAASAVGPRRLC